MIQFGLIAACAWLELAGQASAPVVPSKAAETATEQEGFARRLEVVDTAMAKVVDLRADFEQRRHTPLLKKPLVSKGTVVTRQGRVRWDTATPRASSLLLGDGSIRVYYPADNLLEVYPMGDGFRDLAGAPLPRLSVLEARFDIARLAAKELGAAHEDSNLLAIRLTPKDDALKGHITSVKVLIDASLPAAIMVVMTDPEGEETEIVFSNVKLNTGVKDDEIDLDTPGGVRVSHPLGVGTSGAGAGAGGDERAGPIPAAGEESR